MRNAFPPPASPPAAAGHPRPPPAPAVPRLADGATRMLAVWLSALAGFVDALGYMALGGFYVAFMSGNSTLLGIAASRAQGWRTALEAGLVASFVAGVMLGTLAGIVAGRLAERRRPPAVLALVAALLASAWALHRAGHGHWAGPVMALAMGAENTVFQNRGQSGIGLTYMTGTLVRMGQRLAEALTGQPWRRALPDLLLWLGMVAGASFGALAYAALGLDGLWAAVAAAAVLAASTWALASE